MADVVLVNSNSNNGTTTPASPGSITYNAGDLGVILVAVIGTNPTITGPGVGWTVIKRTNGSTVSFALITQPNMAAGAKNPSMTLGGTVTGWVAVQAEFSQCGANGIIQGSVMQTSAVAQLTDIFQAADNSALLPQLLYLYAVARATATFTPALAGLNPPGGSSGWSASVQPQAGVQGLSLDLYWASGLCCANNCVPQASGLLGSAVASVAIAAWANTTASNVQEGANIGGSSGILVGGQFRGMVGG